MQNEVFINLYNKYRENKLAHAYLIETNNYQKTIEELTKLIKAINCPESYKEPCQNCNLCNLINKSNLPTLKFIYPDGSSIKKEQILSLKESFKGKPLYSKYNVYVIVEAEKMNSSSANTMLKFLEEPEDNIIGFFLTSNKDILIDTIKSRCQVLSDVYSDNITEELGLTPDEYNEDLNFISNLLIDIQKDNILTTKKTIMETFPTISDVNKLFQLLLYLYHNQLAKNLNLDYDKIVDNLKLNEKSQKIQSKIKLIEEKILNMRYNINVELLLDSFIIEMRNVNE